MFFGVAAAGVALSLYASDRAAANSDAMFAGLGEALLGFAITVLLSLGGSITTVAIGTSGRARAKVFTLLFAVLLIGIVVLAWATGGLAFLAFPLLWAVPAASIGLIRWKWAAVIAGGVAVLIVLAVLGGALADKLAQDARNAAYSGPAYGPSTSPQSPLDGYELYYVTLPQEWDTYEGAAMVTLAYTGGEGGYDLDFSEGDPELRYCTDSPDCVVIGEAQGQPVYQADLNGTYYLAFDEGVITLTGYLSPEQALTVFHDLQPMSIDDIGRLRTSVG